MGGDETLPISVEALEGDRHRVRVGDRSEHTVTAAPDVLQRVGMPGERPEQVIERSFRFLLEREPPESILPSFSLDVIARYFPEYWSEMRRQR